MVTFNLTNMEYKKIKRGKELNIQGTDYLLFLIERDYS